MKVVAETDNVADALKNMVSGVSKWRIQPRGLCTMTPLSVYVGLQVCLSGQTCPDMGTRRIEQTGYSAGIMSRR